MSKTFRNFIVLILGIPYSGKTFLASLPDCQRTKPSSRTPFKRLFLLPLPPPPTLLVGPVQCFADSEREARRCRFDSQRLSAGFERLLFGYAKVVLLADCLVSHNLSLFVNTLDPGGLQTYIESL